MPALMILNIYEKQIINHHDLSAFNMLLLLVRTFDVFFCNLITYFIAFPHKLQLFLTLLICILFYSS